MSERSTKFSDVMAELEKIVLEMERGDMPIEESLERYKRGMELIKRGGTILEGVENEVKKIGADGGEESFD